MLVKLLVIVVFIVLLMYVVLPKRRAVPAPARAGRLTVTLLACAGVLLFILALFCALLWLGGISGAVAGAGDVLGGTGLLRIAGLLLVLSIVCAIAALMKRPR
ncbi:hypothetical protein [Bordetella petrii]|uniref:hypothetical protein n=1 Tax=Bordetella petrii TaxID=94624 RepID=UPI001A96DC15|nr:hypothetical protein [Bordetella petrii]MBO1111610.1 hypothetical protein [Bordetella petrii]